MKMVSREKLQQLIAIAYTKGREYGVYITEKPCWDEIAEYSDLEWMIEKILDDCHPNDELSPEVIYIKENPFWVQPSLMVKRSTTYVARLVVNPKDSA